MREREIKSAVIVLLDNLAISVPRDNMLILVSQRIEDSDKASSVKDVTQSRAETVIGLLIIGLDLHREFVGGHE